MARDNSIGSVDTVSVACRQALTTDALGGNSGRSLYSATRTAAWCCVLALCMPVFGMAATLQQGDVLEATPHAQDIGGPRPGDIYLLRQGQPPQTVVHFDDVGSLGVGLDLAGRIYVLRDVDIVVYDATANFLRTMSPGVAFTGPGRIVFDAAGNIYVAGGYKLYKLDPNGNLLATFPLTGLSGIDLGPDQCTMYFTLGKTVGRFDVCQNVRLADVTNTLPTNGYDIRIVPDGSLLIASGVNAVRISAGGAVLTTYGVSAYAIALAPGGRSFWAGPGLNEVDIESGTIETQLPAPSPTDSLAVVGDPRAALAGSQTIPVFSVTIFIGLGAMLVAIALFRLK